ncbi:SCO-spondin isoform X1 [Drosophila suzukii]|uniref:SCO-spondin isoform X1 n=1 Tax=Drosophila suzukii TaxID=28584 RepID=A0AB39Z5K6_DROSZ|nr:SCO-spondin isoform X1 [Drosophila suzukii]
MYFSLFSLVIMWILYSTHAEIPLIESCHHHRVMVKCKPPCPKMCSNYYYTRKCIAKKCERGCACKKGWLLTKNVQGYCIPRASCKRHIIE